MLIVIFPMVQLVKSPNTLWRSLPGLAATFLTVIWDVSTARENSIWAGNEVGLLDIITRETAWCCSADMRSYMRKALVDRWPVVFWIMFSGTLLWNMVVVPVARSEWFVLCGICASSHISLTILPGHPASWFRSQIVKASSSNSECGDYREDLLDTFRHHLCFFRPSILEKLSLAKQCSFVCSLAWSLSKERPSPFPI